jgi:peptidyl-prolyl cis-trans isomerase C
MRRILSRQQVFALANDPLLTASVELAKERVLSEARLAAMDEQGAPTNTALEAYSASVYKANPSRFEQPAQTRASHILLSSKVPDALQRARDILTQLRSGASFEELAKVHSLDPGSGARGGDLGFFGPGKMVKPFEEAVAKLQKPGDLSEIVESEFGYHIIRLDERREKSLKHFDEVREQLVSEARRAAISEGRNQLSQTLSKAISMDNAAIELVAKSSAAE